MARSVLLGWFLVGGMVAGCSEHQSNAPAKAAITVDATKVARLKLTYPEGLAATLGQPRQTPSAPANGVDSDEVALRRRIHQQPQSMPALHTAPISSKSVGGGL